MLDTSSPASHDLPGLFDSLSPITELVTSSHFIFALNKRGGCACYNRVTHRLLRYLNTSSGDIIRSFFFNRQLQALITVSVRSTDTPWALYCRSTPLSSITACPPLSLPLFTFASTSILSSEALQYPGFVEFDDLNQVILSYCHSLHSYKVWSLASYHCRLQLTDAEVREVKTCPGMFLLIKHRVGHVQRLDIHDMHSGHLLRRLDVRMQGEQSSTEYIELFNDKVIIKEQGGPLVIVDALGRGEQRVEGFESPDSFLFLYAADRFLTFKGQQVVRWNGQRGGLVEEDRFEGVSLARGGQTSLLYISQQQDVLVSYGRDADCDRGGLAVNISEIVTGRRLGKVAGWRLKIAQEDQRPITFAEEEEERKLTEAGQTDARRGSKKRKMTAAVSSRRRRSQRLQRLQSSPLSGAGEEEEDDEEEEKKHGETCEEVADIGAQSFGAGSAAAVDEVEWDEAAGEALRSVTALYYNEAMDEIVTGTTDGKVHIWGRG